MKLRTLVHACVASGAVLFAASLGTSASAQAPAAEGDRVERMPRTPVKMTRTGPRTSPFNPPTKDVFVTDASPGLDTGCTFNTSPLNPLTIDIPIDRFVGDVDGNGFLVNPAPLISAGIIPASVDIVLPAFDVDFNGSPPPERDEVLFNGQSLGFLTGDDNVWKLNTFRVDIRRVKFPSRPAAGAQPAPVNNRVQIRIDTLSTGRWCTQVDWIALSVPIRPKLALDLDVVAGNPVRPDGGGANITRIQEQTFDAACNLRTVIGDIERYPFSGPATSGGGGTGSARLKAKIKACPEGSLAPPNVQADWDIGGTSRRGTLNWTGFEREIELQMPPTIGAYAANLKLTLDNGQTIDATRRLYVTRREPLALPAGAPIINYYKLGTEWARGESAEDSVVNKVRSGLYGYGNARWIYGYDAGGGKCTWDQLMANPLACNYSDCYVFSDVLTATSATLGVGGLTHVQVLGNNNMGFMTTAAPSIDLAFPGSAKPVGGGGYDRYVFSSHSLMRRGATFHDSTFNKGYAGSRDFVAANIRAGRGVDANGRYFNTDEGVRIYQLAGVSYRTWGNYAYLLRPPRTQVGAPPAARMNTAAARAVTVEFPAVTAWETPDADRNGRFDALVAVVDVNVLQAGSYVISAELLAPDGRVVASRPNFQSMLPTSAQISGPAGRRSVSLRFSGEQIRRSGIDGPYQLFVYADGPNAEPSGDAVFTTPTYRALDFGETQVRVIGFSATPLDTDASGRFDLVRTQFVLDSVVPFNVQLLTNLSGGGTDLANDSRVMALVQGQQSLSIDLPVTVLARSGIDSPYELSLEVRDVQGRPVDGAQTVLTGLSAVQFEPLVNVAANLIEQRIDSNANGLTDILRVQADASVRAARPAVVRGTLVAVNGASIGVDTVINLAAGSANRIGFDFSGPQIRQLQMDSAYALELSFRNPATLQEFDAVRVPLQGAYIHTQFDPAQPPAAIALNGTLADRGVDTNANGLFDRLQIDMGVDLLQTDTYEWSARLVDRNGQELGFASARGVLQAGSRTIRLDFAGVPIGQNGLDGPYFVRSLLMAGNSGANLVATFAGQTSGFRANQFEGFIVRSPADINGDGVVNQADITAFNRALGSSLGEPNYNRFADFDRDGRITLNDLRLFRSVYPR